MDKKEELRRCGRELFSTKGFKDTNVADITKMAGMAAGTFYLYYPSKDVLFMELFMEENVKLKEELLKSADPAARPIDVMKVMIAKNVAGLYENPILRHWYQRDVFTRIERNYRKEKGAEHFDFMFDAFRGSVEKWQAEGKMRSDIDSAMIMAIFAALVNIDTHKEEIGLQYFPDVQVYISEFVMQGLTNVPEKHNDREG